MKNVRLFAVAAALGMFASTVAAAETTSKTTVKWTGADTIIKVDLGEEVVVPTLTATATTTTKGEACVNGTDANNDGYVDGEIYALDPELNEDQGWLYSNAKYWVTNKTSAKTAMYYLGLGGGKLTGGRFLAPGAAENEGTFTTQGDHKNHTVEELFEEYTKSGLINVEMKFGKYNDEIKFIDVVSAKVYTTDTEEKLFRTVVYHVEPISAKYEEEAKLAALIIVANGAEYVDGAWTVPGMDSRDLAGVTITKKQITPVTSVGQPYQYYASMDDYTATTPNPIPVGGSLRVESYKGSYRVVSQTGATADNGYRYTSGAVVTKFAADTDYLTKIGTVSYDDNGEYEAGTGATAGDLISSKNASFYNKVVGATPYKLPGTEYQFSSEYYVGTKIAVDAKGQKLTYTTFDAIEVDADEDGNKKLIKAEDLLVRAVAPATYGDLITAVADNSGNLTVSTSNVIWDASVQKMYAIAGSLVNGKDYAGDETYLPLVYVDKTAANNTITAADGTKFSLVTNAAAFDANKSDKNKGLYAITKVEDDGTVYYTSVASANYVWDADDNGVIDAFGSGNTQLVKPSKLVGTVTDDNGTITMNYYYTDYEGIQQPVTSSLKKLTAIENPVFDLGHTSVYTAAEKVEEADTIYNAADMSFHTIGTNALYAVKKEVKVSDATVLTKVGKITLVNVDDNDNPYRESVITPELQMLNGVQGAYIFNEETGNFDFVLEEGAYATCNFDDLKNKYVGETKITEANREKLLSPTHVGGLYYVTAPANDSEYYVINTYRSGLNLSSNVNTNKGEMYFDLADGTTLTTKAVELTVDKKVTRWMPAFETEEALVEFVYKLTGLDKALVGTSEDKKETTFKKWYDAAKADYDLGATMLGDEALPTSATAPVHKAENCTYDSESEPTAVKVTYDASKVDTKTAGIYDITYTADVAEGAENATATVKVVVAPKYVRTWGANGKVATLTSFYVSNPEAKYAHYVYDWSAKKVTVTYYNVDGSVASTAVNSL